jgi:hypothetical protein
VHAPNSPGVVPLATGRTQTDTPAPAPDPPGLAALNLGSLVITGVALSGYCLYYTDYFPVVGGLLGLGGIFSCLAFLSGLLLDERKEQLQTRFDEVVLRQHRSWIALGVLLAAFLLWAGGRGTLLIESPGDAIDRVVTISPDRPNNAAAIVESAPLAPHGQAKFLLPTAWWGSRSYRVKVSGLASIVSDVHAFGRTSIASPGAFLRRPILLIRPSAAISATAERATDDEMQLMVKVDGRTIGKIHKYRGEAVWVGGESDVPVPEHLQSRWRLELARDNMPEIVLSRWLTPVALGETTMLAERQHVRVELLHRDGSPYVAKEVDVARVSTARDVPQEVRLDDPN